MAIVTYGPYEKYVEVPHEFSVTGVLPGHILEVDTTERTYRVVKVEDTPIVEVDADADAWPKTVGGGWYELSDGTRIQGADNAQAAQEAIDGSD